MNLENKRVIKLYNSLTNKLEQFNPIKENEVSMYVCGPTVYNHIHIGNSRPLIFFDVVDRFFRYLGYDVKHVSNYTDIDDKIIKKAIEEGVSEDVISTRYIEAYEKISRDLNCLKLAHAPMVTNTMDKIISFIKELENKGCAYNIDGDVFFDVNSSKDYGILSGQSLENLQVGARIDANTKKHSPMDFSLWKKTEVGKKWDSPWGLGRPGWHTECVVMINDYFKNMIDIHGGGLDLKFPHHDNEIAQSMCLFDNHIANYWMHNGRLDLKGEKMSKSLGNVIWAKDLVNEIGVTSYRLLMLSVPYRQLINFTDELIHQAVNDSNKIRKAYVTLFRKIELNGEFKDLDITSNDLVSIKEGFINAMCNDFNTSNALTETYKVIKLINTNTRSKEIDNDYLNQLLKLFNEILYVFGIEQNVNKLSSEDLDIINNWQKARSEKDFEKADYYRNLINERKIEL